jgi:hypothetical protein
MGWLRLWGKVLRADGKRMTVGMGIMLLWQFVGYLPRLILRPRAFWAEYRRRLGRCAVCPVYDPVLRRCGPDGEPGIGCRCFLGAAALPCFKEHGWLTENKLPGADEFCW